MALEVVEADPVRVAPSDLDAEALVISFAFLHGTAEFPDLQPKHFYADANRFVYEALVELLPALPAPIDLVSVASYLQDRKLLGRVGGKQYIAQLMDCIPASSAPHARAHAARVVELWKRRVILSAMQEAIAKLYAAEFNSTEAWNHVRETCRAQRDV